MKKLFLSAALAAVFVFAACNKEDNGVDVSQLSGKWYVANDDPRLSEDGSVTYTFDADGGYVMRVYDFLSGVEITHRGSYMVSVNDSKIITLIDTDDSDQDGPIDGSSRQYFLLKLNSREMKWQEVTYGPEAAVRRLARVND